MVLISIGKKAATATTRVFEKAPMPKTSMISGSDRDLGNWVGGRHERIEDPSRGWGPPHPHADHEPGRPPNRKPMTRRPTVPITSRGQAAILEHAEQGRRISEGAGKKSVEIRSPARQELPNRRAPKR